MSDFTRQARRRTVMVVAVLFLLALALLARLFDLQILRHQDLVARAQEVIWAKIPIHARRGHIFDRTGQPLVTNQKGYVLWVNAKQFKGSREGTALVAQFCERQSRLVVGKIMAGEAEGFYLCSRWLEPEIAERLLAMMEDGQLYGVVLEVEPKRFYPYGRLTAHLLGYLQDSGDLAANTETQYEAHGGLEESYDQLLRGVDGYILMERDPENFMIAIGHREKYPPVDGAQITVTLDINIQYRAQQLLVEAIHEAEAKRGDIVVLDPRDGAILAIATYPSFDPNDIVECASNPECGDYMHVNPAIGLLYEPGSTMKIATLGIALETGVIRPDSAFECTGGVQVGDTVFHNWNYGSHGYETMGEILLHSCNVGAVTVAMRIPAEEYYSYLDRLGFGRPTGVDLTGEVSGQVRSPDLEGWTLVDQAANAFGQAINITPLQLANAVATVANGGDHFRPYIVKAIERDGIVTPTIPILEGRVFREETCRTVTDMLVAIGDTKGKNGGPLIPGYRVALKTGTAQIPIPGVGYEPHRTIASAIGYAPADDPRFLILVRVEGNSVIWGEVVAVPVVGELAEYILGYWKIPPSDLGGTNGP